MERSGGPEWRCKVGDEGVKMLYEDELLDLDPAAPRDSCVLT